jgi:uncharacterized protein YlxW (UPF0749 family)
MKFDIQLKKYLRPPVVSFVLALVVGFVLAAQFYTTARVAEVTDPQAQVNQALEVSILARSNDDLREEVSALQAKQREYDEALQFRLGGPEVLEATLLKYQQTSGLEPTTGAGVVVEIDGPLLDVHLLDLLNTLRNIGVSAVAINNQRIVFNSAFSSDGRVIKLDGIKLTPPYRFEALGNGELLENSLLRTGGLLEQISQTFSEVTVAVTKKDNLTLPAYQGEIEFKDAKVVAKD